jgi:hypothetical protein
VSTLAIDHDRSLQVSHALDVFPLGALHRLKKKKKKKFKYFTGGWRGGLQDNYLLSTHSSTTKQQTVPSEADTRHVRRDDVTEISFFDTQFSAQCTEAAEQDEETQSQVLGHFFFSLN